MTMMIFNDISLHNEAKIKMIAKTLSLIRSHVMLTMYLILFEINLDKKLFLAYHAFHSNRTPFDTRGRKERVRRRDGCEREKAIKTIGHSFGATRIQNESYRT